MSNEEVKTKSGTTHRSYDEAFKRATVAQWQGSVPARQVAEEQRPAAGGVALGAHP